MKTRWLFSTIGKRGYIADYLRQADPEAYIIGTGNTEYTPGFTACDEAILMPDIDDPAYPDAVRRLIREHTIDAVLSFSDPDVVALANLRAELTAAGVTCFFPPPDVALLCHDKWQTAAWALEYGLPSPRTFLDPQEALAAVGLPLVRKPRFGSASVGVVTIHHQADLLPSRNDTTEYLYQEHIAGEELNVEACADQHGRLMSACCWRKLLSRNGETELAVTIQRPDLLAHGLRLAQLIGAVGPCDIDLIERGGLFYLIEFNMRFGGGYPVSQLAGAGFLERLLQAHRSQHVPLHTAYAPDIVMMKSLQPFGGPASRFSVRDSYRP